MIRAATGVHPPLPQNRIKKQTRQQDAGHIKAKAGLFGIRVIAALPSFLPTSFLARDRIGITILELVSSASTAILHNNVAPARCDLNKGIDSEPHQGNAVRNRTGDNCDQPLQAVPCDREIFQAFSAIR